MYEIYTHGSRKIELEKKQQQFERIRHLRGVISFILILLVYCVNHERDNIECGFSW